RVLGVAEPVLEDVQRQCELRRKQLLMELHVQSHSVSVTKEAQMAQLADLVRPDRLLARVLQIPRDVAQRPAEEADARASEGDLRGRGEQVRPVGVTRRGG